MPRAFGFRSLRPSRLGPLCPVLVRPLSLSLSLHRVLRLVPILALVFPVLALAWFAAHAGSSMAMRSAAMPREPYAFTEPSDMPSVSATCASVMSEK
ncbi:hypothetical protein T45_00856 [Streptomyces turgidiscabies]|nr:hypothetical protein T45_00856 [Streptomyces turgidiscabies]